MSWKLDEKDGASFERSRRFAYFCAALWKPRSLRPRTACVSAAETFLRRNSVAAGDAALLAPNILSVKHQTRQHHGLLCAAAPHGTSQGPDRLR
jgi:hypothetical protein